KNEAKDMLISKLKDDLVHETALAIREFEYKLEDEKDRLSKRILSTAIGKASSEFVADATVSVVNLPNDEMKGRIIGREGRNIRTIEALTGVDIIIDDTPEAVVLSSFDGVKREVARRAIEKLINDGRIHPGKIEEVVNKSRKEIEKDIVEAGEQALLELGIPGMHMEIIKTLGKLKYRTSYGQNVLTHSIEVAKLAANLAAELGADTKLAKRAGLLHDVGKVLDHDIEASHAIIGGEFLKKFGEKPAVINAVMAHHNEVEFESVEAILVQASDAISASRPGARRETLSTYLKRLEGLEEIATSFEGVESSYAIQAGREIRIIINPEIVSDDAATKMARDIAKRIEENMQYPGQIKVTILRETRAVEYAK
ncbi:MAG: ribonuclease Y, partial [Cetobacterium sp.]